MNPMNQENVGAEVLPPVPLKVLSLMLGSRHRLGMLREIAHSGDGLIVMELAERLRLPRSNAAKHLKVLRDNGLVVANRAKMHRIPPGRLISQEQAVIDYGSCLLRLGGVK